MTDDQLEDSGLIKTSAFVRTKKSKNALRVNKSKAIKKKDKGISQLNIEIPDHHKNDMKKLAKLLCSGEVKNLDSVLPLQNSFFKNLYNTFRVLFIKRE